MHTTQLTERQALKDLVDTFSNLADEFKIPEQMPLFTQDAVVKTHIGGQLVFEMQGHGQILKTFSDFTSQFGAMYHLNGQHTVSFDSEREASAILYCLVKLANEREVQTHSVRYLDNYVKQGDKWLICKRVAHFLISESHVL